MVKEETFRDLKVCDQFWKKIEDDGNMYMRIRAVEIVYNNDTRWVNAVNLNTGRLVFIEDNVEVDG